MGMGCFLSLFLVLSLEGEKRCMEVWRGKRCTWLKEKRS